MFVTGDNGAIFAKAKTKESVNDFEERDSMVERWRALNF